MSISRRSFLKALLGASGAAVLAACRGAIPPAPPTRAAALASATASRVPGTPPPPASVTTTGTPVPPTETPTPLPPLAYPFPIVRRDEWGARPPNLAAREEHGTFDPQNNPFGWEVYRVPLRDFLSTLVVHHTAMPPEDGPLAVQQLHQDVNGWADVGYHFLVGPDGTLYEGRDLRVRGRQVSGANTGTVGIVLLGNFEEIPSVPAAQLAALEQILGYLARTYDIHYMAGHRDFNPDTLCPGAHLYSHVDAIAGQLGLMHSTQGYVPPAWVLALTPDGRK